MAIGLTNVNNRKASKVQKDSRKATEPAELKSGTEAWSTRGLAREGRSARRERGVSSDDLNPLWLDWTDCVAGSESSTRFLRTVRKVLDLEIFVFEFLVYDLEIPARAKKRILGIRSRAARTFLLRKLLLGGK